MKGTVKTYLPEKQYGFIKGDDGKDYFFHVREFRDTSHVEKLCEDVFVNFEQQATPKGYKAKNCSLINLSEIQTFVVPDDFIASRSNDVRGWDIIEYGRWIVHGSSRDSPDAAKRDVVDSAKRIGANGLINLDYYKTTGSEAGTGSGTHHYTIHNFRGRPVTFGKKSSKGGFSEKDLKGLNDRAESVKVALEAKTYASKKRRNMVWMIVLVLSLFAIGIEPNIIILFLAVGFLFGRSKSYDWWLERA